MGKKKKTTPLKHNGEKGYDTRNFGVFPIEKGKESLDFWDFNFPHNRKSPRIYASNIVVKLEKYRKKYQNPHPNPVLGSRIAAG